MANYITDTDADTYIQANRLDYNVWMGASVQDKTIALTMATKAIDRLQYKGQKAVEGQENQFPRGNDTNVPQDIKNACAELAFAYIDGRNDELEYEDLTVLHRNLGGVSTTHNPEGDRSHIAMGIISLEAYRYLIPYLRDYQTLSVERIN